MARGFASDWVAALNLYAEALSPHVEVIVGLDEVMRVGSQDGISAFVRRGTTELGVLCLSFPHVRTRWEGSCVEARQRALTRDYPCGHPDHDFRPPELREIHFSRISNIFTGLFRVLCLGQGGGW